MNLRNKVMGIFALIISMLGLFPACNFWNSIKEPELLITIDSLSLGKKELSISVGDMEYISVSVKPSKNQKEITLKWTYDSEILECDTSSKNVHIIDVIFLSLRTFCHQQSTKINQECFSIYS